MNYQCISADSHLEVDSKVWLHRVPSKYREQAPHLIRTATGGDAWVVPGSPPREVPADLYGGKGGPTGSRSARLMKAPRAPVLPSSACGRWISTAWMPRCSTPAWPAGPGPDAISRTTTPTGLSSAAITTGWQRNIARPIPTG